MRIALRQPVALVLSLVVVAVLGACGDAAPSAPRSPLESGAASISGRSLWGKTARPDLEVPGGHYALVSVNGVPTPFPQASPLYGGGIWRDAGTTIGRTTTTVSGRNSSSSLGFQTAAVMGADDAGHFGVLLRWNDLPAAAAADSAVWSADTVRVRAGTGDDAVAAGDQLVFVRQP